MKNSLKIISLICFTICLLSCNKFLDKKPDSKLVVPQTLSDMQALMDDVTTNNQRTPSFGIASTDEYFLLDNEYNSRSEALRNVYIWKHSFIGSTNDWAMSYNAIYNANLVLDQLEKLDQTFENKDKRDNIKGSALFFRAYHYLMLLWIYAKAYDDETAKRDLGIVLRESSNFNDISVRTTNQECYQQVIKDATASLLLLPDFPLIASRPSKRAAYGLLARCYLSMRDYKNALLYADSCLALGYELMDFSGDSDIPDGLSASFPFKVFNKEVLFHTEVFAGSYNIFQTSSRGGVDSSIFHSYDNNDLRKIAFFRYKPNGYQAFKGSYRGSNAHFSGIAADEILLIRAECYIRTGEVLKGVADINELLEKRYKKEAFVPYLLTDKEEAMLLVLRERQKELILRGLRWMDIKRLNKEGTGIIQTRTVNGEVYTLLPNAGYYALPIPDDIITMTGIPQNE